MNTPIRDFALKYNKSNTVRAHMPGHKGEMVLGCEAFDITEIKGADSLFECESIIKESEQNAGSLFGAHTYYSCEGSSLSIRAMVFLATLWAKKQEKAPLILATRNAHKTFLSAVALLDLSVEWLCSDGGSYLSCLITDDELDSRLSEMAIKPCAVYVTSPDYLGNTLDISGLSKVCKKHSVLLIVDNAHGAYLKFLENSLHPIDLGADMCCDSAHKTLPVLTGGGYLHISKNADSFFKDNAKKAMSLFASTSPSYLILQSLDLANAYIANGYKEKLSDFTLKVDDLKKKLTENGYTLSGNEPLKITLSTKPYGYTGGDFAELLRKQGVECEFADPDFVVLMLTPSISDNSLSKIRTALLSIKQRQAISVFAPPFALPKKAMSVRDAVMSPSKTEDAVKSEGKVLSVTSVSCPPAVPVVVSGELIDKNAVALFEYYGITSCEIVDT